MFDEEAHFAFVQHGTKGEAVRPQAEDGLRGWADLHARRILQALLSELALVQPDDVLEFMSSWTWYGASGGGSRGTPPIPAHSEAACLAWTAANARSAMTSLTESLFMQQPVDVAAYVRAWAARQLKK